MRRRRLGLQLWAGLVCLASVAALLIAILAILAKIDGWLQYETGPQLATEIGGRVSIPLALAILLATAATALSLPYVFGRPGLTAVRHARVLRAATVTVLAVCGSACIGITVRWLVATGLVPLTTRAQFLIWACLTGLLAVGLVARSLLVASKEWMDEPLRAISGPVTRRLLLLAGIGSLLTGLSVGAERRLTGTRRRSQAQTTGPNVLLVTFDALSAEDMSCYGHPLPTTPNIDRLAQSSYLFSNYYAVSTFTTPCIASMFTGCYPSSNRVYHYGGSLHGKAREWTASNVLREYGYATAASVSNPGAHPACLGFADDFDILPAPALTDVPTREVTMLFRSADLAEDFRIASHFAPHMLEHLSPRVFGQVHSTFPPERSFQQAERILHDLPAPFFLWVHAFAPHFPYLPEPPYLHRFLPTDELRTQVELVDMTDRAGYAYSPARQPLIDKGRLRYNEWIAQADGAFGRFMATAQESGRLTNTAVIVSADHGESFQGGYLGHAGARQLRPILHVPLLVHLPRQDARQDVHTAVDQTLLAPTMLELAGIRRPQWMTGPTLQSVLRGDGSGLPNGAYTQYLAENSVFKPITNGTMGVIAEGHQFVLDVSSGAGGLFDLAEAHEQRVDRSSAEPALAAALRGQILSRFPDAFRRHAGNA